MFSIFVSLLVIVQIIHGEHGSVQRCARAAGACLLAPEVTEGPFYWNSTVRRDITEGKPGIPLRLSLTILDTKSCSPISGALVDLWHCDVSGAYSHFLAGGMGPMNRQTDNTTFFRGQQMTDSKGIATFDTVYPGWYQGRTTHMHVKVHIGSSLTNVGGAVYAKGGHVSHTGQLFFDDALTDTVAKISPYSSGTSRRVRNTQDGIYRESNGVTMTVAAKSLGSDVTKGMIGEITVGVDPSATPALVDFGGPPNGGRPPRPSSPRPKF